MSDDSKLLLIRKKIDTDLLTADILWSLLTAAAVSYRHDTVLRPFPPMFVSQTGTNSVNDGSSNDNSILELRNYAELARALSQMPSLQSFLNLNSEGLSKFTSHSVHLIELLHWALFSKSFVISSCDDNKYSEIVEATGQSVHVPPPQHVFSVQFSLAADERFNELRGNRAVILAYHGSRLENFHSILNYGLQGHMNKNAMFGEGTYLSSELSVCLHYSPFGTGWEHSIIGKQLSCVAVCEIIDDPSVKCKTHDTSNAESRRRIQGSIGGDVPEKYYIVQNNDMMRIKYLLVYASRVSSPRSKTFSWLRQHRFAIAVSFYIIMLLALGLFNSNALAQFRRRFVPR